MTVTVIREARNNMTNLERHSLTEGVALRMLPAFRDKFDFSNPKDFASLAVLAFEAGYAFVDHAEKLKQTAIEEDAKADAKEAALRQAEKEKKK